MAFAGCVVALMASSPLAGSTYDEIEPYSCRSAFGVATTGLDKNKRRFIVLSTREGRPLYEATGMFTAGKRRAWVNEFCESGNTPHLRREHFSDWPHPYVCEGLNGEKARTESHGYEYVRIKRFWAAPPRVTEEFVRLEMDDAINMARHHCLGKQFP